MITDMERYFDLLEQLSRLHPENKKLIANIDLAYAHKDDDNKIARDIVFDFVWEKVRTVLNGFTDDETRDILEQFKKLWTVKVNINVDTCRVVTADEIVNESAELEAKFNKRTLYNYTANKCIPEPKRGAGYGGKWVEYNKLDVIWATIAWRMIHGVYYPENKEGDKNIISGIRPPKTPPKTVGILHKEFIKRYKEIVGVAGIRAISPLFDEEYIIKNCWRDERDDLEIMVLRGMMAWYAYLFVITIMDISQLEASKKIKKENVLGTKEFKEIHNNKRNEVKQYIKKMSID